MRFASLTTAAVFACIATVGARAQQPTEVERETAYASSIVHVADSAIRRLDFFPARAQLRVQMLFLAPGDSAPLLFREVARRAADARDRLDDISSRFERTGVPEDLGALHHDLVGSLRSARTALDRLTASANACLVDATSVVRCQSPFTSASSAVGDAYRKYLDARAKIREQILDTQTLLPEFVVSTGGRAAPQPRKTALRVARRP